MAPNPSSSSKPKSGPDASSTAQKRAKTNGARTLAVKSSDIAISKTGERGAGSSKAALARAPIELTNFELRFDS